MFAFVNLQQIVLNLSELGSKPKKTTTKNSNFEEFRNLYF